MRDEIFADGIGEITVTGPTVRIDLVSLSPNERDPNNNPRAVFRQRVVMTVDSFVSAYDLMEQAVRGLIQSGIVTRRPAARPEALAETAPQAGAAAFDAAASPATRAKGSPNFQ